MDSVSRKRINSVGPDQLPRHPGTGAESLIVQFDPGSFRDRTSRVFLHDGDVFRALTAESKSTWDKASQSPFFQNLIASGLIVDTAELSADQACSFVLPMEFVSVLRHRRIPFISYPYEWSFGMLRQAALVHLRILTEAVRGGFILKDASPYNVQFCGAQPVFIDLGSFIELPPGEPWTAYRQFCELMLFPLLLQSYRNVHLQPLLRANLEGIPAKHFMQWMRWRDLFRSGVFVHGWLQSALERNTQSLSTSTVRDLRSSGFQSSMIERMLQKLTGLVEKLKWTPERTQWTAYDNTLPHVADDLQAKSEFVSTVCRSKSRHLVWDLGCNDGRYSVIAAEHADLVVAMDQDHACIEQLYQTLAAKKQSTILPLCVELANSSPALGWRGRERKRLEDRGSPELVLCLGLIHHLVLAGNIPLSDVIDWLASFGGEIILEFPSKNDPMVKALLRNKRDQYSDYSLERLEFELLKRFEIPCRRSLPSGERTLFHAVPKAPSEGAV